MIARPDDPRRWREIDAVFAEALELEPSERADFLRRRCGEDDELLAAVRELLEADARSAAFMDGPAQQLAPDDFADALERHLPDPGPDRVGERVGAFRITRQLGRGGMAGVYEAVRDDGAFEQRVAIKFLRRGLDTDDFIRRFVVERQILSALEHPNIARLLDGGATEQGLPYLVLEYVDGVPIAQYCDEHRLGVEERLQLFLQVARAVQYAHTKLIVHRDIKPSNILVTESGDAKLLDFGIAKLLDPEAVPVETPLTRTGFRPLTPGYASPEQVRGEPITTASDVFQLGILLYRLVTGARPYDAASTGTTLEETLLTTRPKTPSQVAFQLDAAAAAHFASSSARLGRRLRGDLDTIILKALRSEPSRRYATAHEMADDVQRHLDARPIAARRESALYLGRKFLARNAWVAPVSLVGVVLVGAYLWTLTRHAAQLEEERNVARDVQGAFVSFFTAPDSADYGLGEGRRDLTILQAILEGTDRVREDLADRPAARAELFVAMAEVLQDLDETDRAYDLASEALAIDRDLYGERSPQVQEALLVVGELTTDGDSARARLERQLDLSRELYGASDAETARSLYALAELDLREGKLEDAVERIGGAIDIYRTAEGVHPSRLAWALAQLSDNLSPLDRTDEAVAAAREAYDIMVRTLGAQHSQTATVGAKLGEALTSAGLYNEARPVYESSLAVMDAELGPTHATTMTTRNNYAILLRLTDSGEAEAVYRELLEQQRERYGETHSEVAATLQNLAATVKDQGRYDEAEALSRQAFEMFEKTNGRGHFQTAYPLLTISEIRLARGDFRGAEEVSREAFDLLRAALPPGHFATAVAECRLGRALVAQGKVNQGRPLLSEGEQALRAAGRREVEDYLKECEAAVEAS